MIEGDIEIRWVSSPRPSVSPRIYSISFASYHSDFQPGAQPHKEIRGAGKLFQRLIDLQSAELPIHLRAQQARAWVLEIHSRGSILLRNSQITREQYQEIVGEPTTPPA